MNHQLKIAPSLLACDFSNLESEVKNCEKYGADILHVDVMDGHFVPNITIGPLIVKSIKPHTSLPIDCHLMITNPDDYIDDFADAGADYISVHAEVCNHLHRTLTKIKERNCKAGIVLNPVTPLQFAYDAAEYCDFILLMSVNPGFGGQSFIPSFLEKCTKLREHLDRNGLNHVEIEVDGGVKIDNIREVVNAGANMIVSGSGLFKGDLEKNIREMRLAVI
ncbi:MAG: ribulose-phosphate 3-epimerase [Candidatus Kapaibacterium sp.]|nr:ribulose-phosphate 3-epimerase [Ignavibacteriota bacterium]